MPILFACDRCQRAYELPDVAAGRQAKCECGQMLTVPPETPPQHAGPPAPSRKIRSPRTLKQAALMAQQAASSSGSESDTPALNAGQSDLSTSSIETAGHAPPPISPVVAHPSSEASTSQPIPSDSNVSRYRKLQQYAAGLRSQANRLYWIAGFITVVLVAICLLFSSNSVNQNVLQALLGLFVAALAWSAAYSAALLLKATADFLQVAMDVEENTRRIEENTRN